MGDIHRVVYFTKIDCPATGNRRCNVTLKHMLKSHYLTITIWLVLVKWAWQATIYWWCVLIHKHTSNFLLTRIGLCQQQNHFSKQIYTASRSIGKYTHDITMHQFVFRMYISIHLLMRWLIWDGNEEVLQKWTLRGLKMGLICSIFYISPNDFWYRSNSGGQINIIGKVCHYLWTNDDAIDCQVPMPKSANNQTSSLRYPRFWGIRFCNFIQSLNPSIEK